MSAPGRLHIGCRVGHRPTPAFRSIRPHSIRRGRSHVTVCALFKQVITDQQQLAKQANKYGLVVTELRDIDVVESVAEVQRVAGMITGRSSQQQQQQVVEVVHPPVQVVAAPMAAPAWLMPCLMGAAAAVGVGLATVKAKGGAAAAPIALPFATAAAPAALTTTSRAAAAASAAAVLSPPASSAAAAAAAAPVGRTSAKSSVASPAVTRPGSSSSSARPPTPVVTKATAASAAAARTGSLSPAVVAVPAAAVKVAAPSPTPGRLSTPAKPISPRTSASPIMAATVAAPLAPQVRSPSPLLPPAVLSSAAEELLQPLSSKAGQLLDKMSAVFTALDPQAAEKAAAAEAAAFAAAAAASAAALASSKASLLDLLYATGRGLGATPEQRGQVEEQVTALEVASPARSARLALAQLAGTWKLLYTNHTPTLLVLNALHSLPLADLGEVYQVVDAEQLTAYNQIDLALLWMLSLTARSPLAPASSGRSLRLGFSHVGLHTHIHTPQLLAALTVPDQVSVMGATLDLKPLQRLLNQVNTRAASAQQLVDTWVSAPTFPVAPAAAEPAAMWLLTTYLDDTLRISRDANGRVFVMVKDIRLPEEGEEGAEPAAAAAAGAGAGGEAASA